MIEPTEENLKHGAKFIAYEYEMLDYAAREWKRREYASAQTRNDERRVLTDSALVHARCLLEFLAATENAHPDTVKGLDYGGPGMQDFELVDRPLNEWREPLHKLLAHPSYERRKVTAEMTRASPDGSRWPIPELNAGIAAALRTFLDGLDPAKRAWFARLDDLLGDAPETK